MAEEEKESFKVDLENQKIQIISSGKSENFAIDAYKKTCLINGFDDIDFLVSKLDAIKKFEEKQTMKFFEKNENLRQSETKFSFFSLFFHFFSEFSFFSLFPKYEIKTLLRSPK